MVAYLPDDLHDDLYYLTISKSMQIEESGNLLTYKNNSSYHYTVILEISTTSIIEIDKNAVQ